ncbi:mitotic checkpoint protein BUB3,1 [Ceratobasidium sp. AG-Ba]|nr:mitotic checkpoint protein BUB3,1 [Ceratobasidium sp. AG-Ba]
MADHSPNEFELDTQPLDTISALRFSPSTPQHLLAASWDGNARLYDIAQNDCRSTLQHKAAVLDCCFSGGNQAFTGGLDTWVRSWDLETEKMAVLGAHDATVSCVSFAKDSNLLVTGSWDKTVRLWDPRGTNPASVGSPHTQPERVYRMDLVGNMLVVGYAGRLVHIYDTRKLDDPLQIRESSLKYMTRAIACMADGQGYACASIEGRVSVEYFDPAPEVQAKRYAFKCHRRPSPTEKDVDQVWSVNALVFHPTYGTFASGGSDGTVCFWDHSAKKRLRQTPRYREAVSALAFNSSGSKIAVGVGYMWDEGEEGGKRSRPGVIIRDVGSEIKAKSQS